MNSIEATESINVQLAEVQKKCSSRLFTGAFAASMIASLEDCKKACNEAGITRVTKITMREASGALPNAYKGGDCTWISFDYDPATGEFSEVKVARGFAPHGPHGQAKTSWEVVYVSAESEFKPVKGWRRDIANRCYTR